MKKYLYFALMGLMSLAMAACQGNGNEPSKKEGIKITITDVSYTSATLSFQPHDTLAPYFCSLTKKDEYMALTDEERIESAVKDICTLIGYGPITGEIKHFSDYTTMGNNSGTIDELSIGTRYVVWACYMDTIMRVATSPIYTAEFETLPFPVY